VKYGMLKRTLMSISSQHQFVSHQHASTSKAKKQVHGQHQRALEFHRKNLIIAMMRCQLCNIEDENIAQHNLEESCRHLDSDNSVGGDFTR